MALLVLEDFVENGALQNTCRAWRRDEALLQGRGDNKRRREGKTSGQKYPWGYLKSAGSPLGSLKISQNAAVPALHSWEIHSSS